MPIQDLEDALQEVEHHQQMPIQDLEDALQEVEYHQQIPIQEVEEPLQPQGLSNVQNAVEPHPQMPIQDLEERLQPQGLSNVQNAASNTPAAPIESTLAAGATKGGKPGGFQKVCGVSPELQAIVGGPVLPRTKVVKNIWTYIKEHNLQDPTNKRNIICDEPLKTVFETDRTDMFSMNKLLSKHITSFGPPKKSRKTKRLKVGVETASGSTEPSPPPLILSEALANFFGTGETEMIQSEALQRVQEYIKDNDLEDPMNSMINCDAKLQVLLGRERISAAEISEMLAGHLSQP